MRIIHQFFLFDTSTLHKFKELKVFMQEVSLKIGNQNALVLSLLLGRQTAWLPSGGEIISSRRL